PFGARTIPSRRRVATCKPAFPGGRLAPARAAASWRLVRDSKGSRREALVSDSAGAPTLAGAVAAFFGAADFFAVFAAGFAAGFAVAAGAGLAAAEAAGCAGFAAGVCAGLAAGFAGVAAGLVWACKLLPAVASRTPVITVMARRMARSSLLTVSSP